MESSELRLNNLIFNDSVINKVWLLAGPNVNGIDSTQENFPFTPISLTEEWLLKFGFETDGIEWWNGILSIGIYKDGLFYCPTGKISLRIGKEIQYLHQLQNLYFALIGEELINLE